MREWEGRRTRGRRREREKGERTKKKKTERGKSALLFCLQETAGAGHAAKCEACSSESLVADGRRKEKR